MTNLKPISQLTDDELQQFIDLEAAQMQSKTPVSASASKP